MIRHGSMYQKLFCITDSDSYPRIADTQRYVLTTPPGQASFILTKRVSIHYSRDWWFGYPPARGPLPRPRAVLLPRRMRRLYPSRAGLQVPHTYMHRYEHAFRTSENTQAEPGGGGGFLKNAYDSRRYGGERARESEQRMSKPRAECQIRNSRPPAASR